MSDPSGVHYEILRDDRPIATHDVDLDHGAARAPPAGSSSRAEDGAGNVGASTSVLVVGYRQRPAHRVVHVHERPQQRNFDGSGSTSSDGTITDYLWDFGDGTGAHGQTTSATPTRAQATTSSRSPSPPATGRPTPSCRRSPRARRRPTRRPPTSTASRSTTTIPTCTTASERPPAPPWPRTPVPTVATAPTARPTPSLSAQPGALANSTDTALGFNGSPPARSARPR